MPFFDRERFQVFCRFCQGALEGGKLEADSAEEALRRIAEHEKTCPKSPQRKP
jgi:hypothetical protein